jgi:hypothetical protein
MKTRRKAAPRRMVAQVISMEAYRRARAVPETEPRERDSVMNAYCRWLALAGAIWVYWW